MGYEWRYEGAQHVGFEYDGGTVDVWVADHNGVAQMQHMPFSEFLAAAAVMYEEHRAWIAEQETKADAKLVREVMALSGLGPGELADLVGGIGFRTVHLWISGAPISSSRRERLLHLREVFDAMSYYPHLGRRHAVFSTIGDGVNLYERLRRELPRGEPIQGAGY